MHLRFNRKTTQYIFFEMIPGFLIGLAVFIFVMLLFQALRLTEFVLVHGVGIGVIFEIISYMSVSFLPALLPMALLFSVLMTYGRLSQDSEIIALKASGISMFSILLPAVLLSVLIGLLSAQVSFQIAPWGNRRFELLVSKLGQSKAGMTVREGTFSEGFFDLVVYANEVDSKSGKLKKVFIYDERKSSSPLAIVAKEGEIIQQGEFNNMALLRLKNGNIHRKTETHTKIDFDSFDIKLIDPVKETLRAKSPPSMTLDEIEESLKQPELAKKAKSTLMAEYHKRWAVSLVCVIFGLLGVGLGTSTNRRQQKSSGLVLSLGVIVGYWVLYLSAEGLARSGGINPAVAIWIPNLIFSVLSIWRLRTVWD